MIFTTTDTLTPDTDPEEGGAILKKELPERNPPLLFGLGKFLFRQNPIWHFFSPQLRLFRPW